MSQSQAGGRRVVATLASKDTENGWSHVTVTSNIMKGLFSDYNFSLLPVLLLVVHGNYITLETDS